MKKRTCSVCGKSYSYCPRCDHSEPKYKTMFCSEVCKDIWNTLSMNGVGKLNAEDALDQLMKYEMPENLTEGVQNHIDKLINEIQK